MRPVILHISNDYPDPLAPNKTKAVLNLVEGSPQYRHVVYSLNRVSAVNGLAHIPFGEDRIAMAYGALPKGILWEGRLLAVARWIIADLKAKGITPDLVEAHKFTIEGFIGQDVAKAFSCPLICDIQGYTDINILQKKKAWYGRYREIAVQCAAVFPYAPWPLPAFEEAIGLDAKKCHFLPVIPSVDTMGGAPVITEDKILSVFHLDGWKNKNFEGMAMAVQKLVQQGRKVTLDIYGAGTPKTLLALHSFIEKNGLQGTVRLMGAAENRKLPEIMKKYAAFVMPSKSESYGLVYVEALFSGVPVMFNAKRGISGYFDAAQIGYGCDPSNVDDIAKGILHMLEHQKKLKDGIEQLQKSGTFDILRKSSILKTYSGVIDNILERC